MAAVSTPAAPSSAVAVLFSRMQVHNFYVDPFGRMKLYKTLFKGAANFSDLEVDGVFNANHAIFKSENTIFSGLKVGQGAFFNGTIFFGGLVLKEGQLTDLVIRGLHRLSEGGLPLEEIVLNRTRIAHRLTIEDVEVKRFTARNLEVKGPTELQQIGDQRRGGFPGRRPPSPPGRRDRLARPRGRCRSRPRFIWMG